MATELYPYSQGNTFHCIDKFQAVVGAVIVRFRAVQKNHVAFFGIKDLVSVFYMKQPFPDIDHQQRGISFPLHVICAGAEKVAAPGRVEIKLFGQFRRREGETDRV